MIGVVCHFVLQSHHSSWHLSQSIHTEREKKTPPMISKLRSYGIICTLEIAYAKIATAILSQRTISFRCSDCERQNQFTFTSRLIVTREPCTLYSVHTRIVPYANGKSIPLWSVHSLCGTSRAQPLRHSSFSFLFYPHMHFFLTIKTAFSIHRAHITNYLL